MKFLLRTFQGQYSNPMLNNLLQVCNTACNIPQEIFVVVLVIFPSSEVTALDWAYKTEEMMNL